MQEEHCLEPPLSFHQHQQQAIQVHQKADTARSYKMANHAELKD